MNSSVKFKCLNKTIMLLTKHVYEELVDPVVAKRSNTHLRIIINTVAKNKNGVANSLIEGGKVNSIKNIDRKANYK